jgi:hypothetical protein
MSEPHRNTRLPRRGSLVLLLQVVALLSTFGCASAAAQSPAQPRFSDPLRFVVNVPAFRLDVYENGYLTTSYPVTVGQPREPTPIGTYKLQKVVWNPWWHPPYNRRPKDKVTPPGPKNPMGKVKLYFADLYYLHGTPKEHEIGSPASRGCVRLRNEDAIALAQLVHRYAVAPLPETKLEELASTRSWKTHNYALQTAVPVDLVYDLVEVKDGEMYVYRDLYRNARFPLPELATRALEAAGYSRDQFDAESVKAALAPAMEPGANKAVVAKKGEPPPPPELVRVSVDDLVGGGTAIAGGLNR